MTKMESIADVLENRARFMGSKLAFEFSALESEPKQGISYATLQCQATAIELYLRAYCSPRSRVAICLPTGPHFVAAIFGIFQAGCVAVPVYPAYRGDRGARLAGIIADCSPEMMLIERSDMDAAAKIVPATGEKFSMVPIEDLLENTVSSYQPNNAHPKPRSEDLAILQYTSGSTAAPKGVMITHGNLLHNSKCIAEMFGHDANSRAVIWLPPHHDMGLVGGIIQPVFVGFPVVLMPPSSFLKNPYAWLRLISEEKATVRGGPNLAYEMCIAQITDSEVSTLDLSSWKVAFNGSEAIAPQTISRFVERFQQAGFKTSAFCPCYGLAESTLLVTAHRMVSADGGNLGPALSRERQNLSTVSSGRPGPGVMVRIVDPTTGTEIQDGRVGEIWVASPSNATGYWNRETASLETFRAQLPGSESYFLRTGDLGFLSEGELTVQGRAAETIVIGGVKFHPSDIENCLQRAGIWPSRSTLAAVPAPLGRPELGFSLIVEISPGSEPSPETSASRAIQAVKRHFSITPNRVAFAAKLAIPRTPTGKLRRVEAAHRLELGELKTWRIVARNVFPTEEADSAQPHNICELLVGVLQNTIGDQTITADTNLLGLGLTSVELLVISKILREKTGFRVDLEVVLANPTPRELVRAIRQEHNREVAPNV